MKGPQPPPDYVLPIGTSSRRCGRSDVTVVSVSRPVHEARWRTACAEAEGVSVEVIDLRTVVPLDMVPILESVHKTKPPAHRPRGGRAFRDRGGDIPTVAREGFWDLDAPIERIEAAPTPSPCSPVLERAWLPDREDIAAAVRRLAAVIGQVSPAGER